MKIELLGAKPLTEEAISQFEIELGFRLPDRFRQFVAVFNGAEPTDNSYDDDVNARYFISVNEIIKEKNEYLYQVSENVIPIAESEGGCYILLKLDDDTIWFWDREFPKVRKQLATDIYDFLEKLHPDDPSTIEIPEGAKVTYSNPAFDEEQRRLGNMRPDKKSMH